MKNKHSNERMAFYSVDPRIMFLAHIFVAESVLSKFVKRNNFSTFSILRTRYLA